MPTEPNDAGIVFSAIPLGHHKLHRLAKDSQGRPAVLVAVAVRGERGLPSPIVLKHISVQHDVNCRVTDEDGAIRNAQFTVIRCITLESGLHRYFLQVVDSVLTSLGEKPSHAEIAASISTLVELFRAMDRSPEKSVRGLWAELAVMARLRDPTFLVHAWRSFPNDRFDFSFENQRIDVKSTSSRIRNHNFALEQLDSVGGMRILIASIFVERAGAGLSIADLAGNIRAKMKSSPDVQLRFMRILGASLGHAWQAATEDRFDFELARHSLEFYDAEAIPKVSIALPPGVSNVHFRSDLTVISPVDSREYRSVGPLFAAVLSRQ